MVYTTAIHVPETPIVEELSWETDISTSYDGSEDRIPLLRYPKRRFTGKYAFTELADLRRHLATMMKAFKGEFSFPVFVYQAKLKSNSPAGTRVAFCNGRRGNFRVGQKAILIEGAKFEEVTIEAVELDRLQFVAPLVQGFSARANVAPLTKVYSAGASGVVRKNPDNSADATFTYEERLPTIPFVPPLNTVAIATFDGLPVLPHTAIGGSFDNSLVTGLSLVEYLNFDDIVSPWTFAQWSYNLTFKAELFGTRYELEWWIAFLDLIQGQAFPFLFPTNRADFEILPQTNAGGSVFSAKGNDYSQHYYEHDAFRRIFIDTDAGRHLAKVTSVLSDNGNERLVFDPPLPNGAGWARTKRVGFLLKVRNGSDKVTLTHFGLSTEVNLSLRTVV